jgi:hypothetical protein
VNPRALPYFLISIVFIPFQCRDHGGEVRKKS